MEEVEISMRYRIGQIENLSKEEPSMANYGKLCYVTAITREAGMRGLDEWTGSLFSYADLEDRVPAKHPLRITLRIVNDVLAALDSECAKNYADSGRPSISPERLLRALLLQAFYMIRSETQLIEQLDYNLSYR